MMELMRAGGVPMWIVLLFGLAAAVFSIIRNVKTLHTRLKCRYARMTRFPHLPLTPCCLAIRSVHLSSTGRAR